MVEFVFLRRWGGCEEDSNYDAEGETTSESEDELPVPGTATGPITPVTPAVSSSHVNAKPGRSRSRNTAPDASSARPPSETRKGGKEGSLTAFR
jgi:hypothetical protein